MTSRSALDVERLRALVGDRWPRIEVVDETTSTNGELVATADGRTHREVLAAERQTAGRGRLDRVWTSPPGAGLLFSVITRPRVPIAQWGWLPLLSGLALVEAVDRTTGLISALKWPNDLLLGPGLRKAAGILVQTAGDAAVIGIGVNVSTTSDELGIPTTTSIGIEGVHADRTALLAEVLSSLDERLGDFEATAGDPERSGIRAAYRVRCATLGRRVRVSMTGGPPLEGTAVDVDGSGRLVLEVDSRPIVVSAGDVEHVRLA